MQLQIAYIISESMKSHVESDESMVEADTEAVEEARLEARWRDTLLRNRKGLASTKDELCVIWTMDPYKLWELKVLHDTVLAFVDANIRYVGVLPDLFLTLPLP